MDAEELSAYELERLANIKRNEEKLSALGLSTGIVPVAAAPRPKRKKSEVTRPPAAPSRRSGRIEGSKAPELYVEHETGSGTRCVVTVGGDRSLLEAEAKVSSEAELDPLELFSMGAMPEDAFVKTITYLLSHAAVLATFFVVSCALLKTLSPPTR